MKKEIKKYYLILRNTRGQTPVLLMTNDESTIKVYENYALVTIFNISYGLMSSFDEVNNKPSLLMIDPNDSNFGSFTGCELSKAFGSALAYASFNPDAFDFEKIWDDMNALKKALYDKIKSK